MAHPVRFTGGVRGGWGALALSTVLGASLLVACSAPSELTVPPAPTPVVAVRVTPVSAVSPEAAQASRPVGGVVERPPVASVAAAPRTVPSPQAARAVASLPPAPAQPRQIGNVLPPTVSAKHVAILDEPSGAILYGANERVRVAPASVTKIVTALVALERPGLDMDRLVDVSISASEMLVRDGSQVMGLEPGERVKLRTLLYGLMLWSGNDAAEQLALSLTSGNRQRYLDWMNARVEQLGLKDSSFKNPSGMDAPGHFSTAYDMAMVARAAMQRADFRALAAAQYYQDDGYPIPNINRFLLQYPGADGVKTGYTDDAGRTIVASATQNGRRLYVSLMKSDDLVADATRLLDWAWKNFDFAGPRP